MIIIFLPPNAGDDKYDVEPRLYDSFPETLLISVTGRMPLNIIEALGIESRQLASAV